MKHSFGIAAVALALVSLLVVTPRSEAQTVSGPMTNLVNNPTYAGYFDPVERATAVAMEVAANEIVNACDCAAFNNSNVYQGLEASANQVNQFSPGDPQAVTLVMQIAGALRGVAPEELSAQRTASNEFARSQEDQLRGRLDALRGGAQGFALNGYSSADRFARRDVPLIGGASADDLPADFARWGGFFNVGYTHGTHDATPLEDAFTAKGTDFSLGADYRFSAHGVLGLMLGYTDHKLTFDSTQSAPTDGEIKSKGWSEVLYASYDWDGPYVSASVGRQQLSNDMIRIAHFEVPIVATPTDVVNSGSSDSTATTLTLDGGWALQSGAFGYEPLVRVLYRDTKFDAFNENSVDISTGNSSGLEFDYAERKVKSLNTALGMKVDYAFKPSFGVLIPYLQAEYQHEFKDDPMQTSAIFGDVLAQGATSSLPLAVNSDNPDKSYFSAEIGAAAVFKHGIQAFLSARSLFALADAKLYVISAGVRGEF